MNSIIESAYFATAMLGPGLLKKKNNTKKSKLQKNEKNVSIEIFLREILGTRLVQPAITASKKN